MKEISEQKVEGPDNYTDAMECASDFDINSLKHEILSSTEFLACMQLKH